MLKRTTPLDVDETVACLKQGIEAQGMRLVSHINGQANAARIGKQVPGDQVLEVFRPDFAIRVWEACKPAGIEIPVRIHVYEDGEGMTRVACRPPSALFARYESTPLNAIGLELDVIFEAILDSVPEVVHA
ncbi:DUF302 domain-containing protein [Thioalkalivibrio sulfidiphilus]|uniref:DUF302 domain-containing protein n=1 Tax=Thioalkalivibrio sulfidiphilus TaxID=1033854 RepID=UPI00036DE67D|nr:DUF302 domain-containing protein [Thioalkalivibrio sulfidiphilus]